MWRELSRRLRQPTDEGFTLVEVIVSILIVAVIGAAMLPLLSMGIRASRRTKLETQSKNLTQQRVERMRNLAFHVDRQNGPFIDLLDVYYTDLTTSTTTRSDGTQARWIANNAGANDTPVGPTYHVHIPSIDGYPTFTQDIYTQFLRTTHTLVTVPTNYSSQVAGVDQPPASLLGVTVITSYTDGDVHSYRTYTEIADGVRAAPLITTQANALAVRVTSTGDTGVTYLSQIGSVVADGSLTSGSSASVRGESARAEITGLEEWLGAIASAVAPPNPSSTLGSTLSANSVRGSGSSSCGWASFGKTQVENYSANTAGGYPVAPANAGSDVRTAGAGVTKSGVVRNGGGCESYAFTYMNSNSTSLISTLFDLDQDRPQVWIKDPGGSGYVASGEGSITATDTMASTLYSSARASASVLNSLRILSTNTYEEGLVRVRLNSSSITCVAGEAVSAAYSLSVDYPAGAGTYATANVTLANGTVSGSIPDPAGVSWVDSTGTTRRLSEYLSWQTSTGVTSGENGLSSLGPVLRVAVSPDVVGNGGITVDVGTLSCAADDNR